MKNNKQFKNKIQELLKESYKQQLSDNIKRGLELRRRKLLNKKIAM